MSGRLAGKVALITGAGMGMGRETAALFAEEGARIIVADIDAEAAKGTVARVEKAGGEAVAVTGDVAIEADVQRMIEEGVRRFGALHVLHNNAGVLWKDRDRSVLETDDRWWEELTTFFNVRRSRAWVMTRRLTHTSHHRGQQMAMLRMLGRELHSNYGPTADTGGLMQNHAPTIYAYSTVEALLEGESQGGAKSALPSVLDRSGVALTERPSH